MPRSKSESTAAVAELPEPARPVLHLEAAEVAALEYLRQRHGHRSQTDAVRYAIGRAGAVPSVAMERVKRDVRPSRLAKLTGAKKLPVSLTGEEVAAVEAIRTRYEMGTFISAVRLALRGVAAAEGRRG